MSWQIFRTSVMIIEESQAGVLMARGGTVCARGACMS
jgi:hypothetical protein